MAKQQGRKPPKRKPARPKLDDDLIELASVLAEEPLAPYIANWFSIPWRDGWNAAMLARDCYGRIKHLDSGVLDPTIEQNLMRWILERQPRPMIYETAGDAIMEVSTMMSHHNLSSAGLLLCGLRCTQLVIANSSGGGATFNELLKHRFDQLSSWATAQFAEHVREARCWDAIGVGVALKNDYNDRYRRAFKIAWDRGLYRAAYAIPRAQ